MLVALGLAYFARTTPGTSSAQGESDAGPSERPDAFVARQMAAPRTHADERPDILLFTIDTLRPDHLSTYRYDRDTSPTIDALARRGTRFDRAYTTSSWTVAAIASLLTGVIPSEHGVTHAEVQLDHTLLQEVLSAQLPSLAGAMQAAGYRTVGITASAHFAASLGYGRGFDDYECLGFVASDNVEAAVTRRIEALRQSDRPFFLWVHVVDPHVPYEPAEPQFTQWWGTTRPRYPTIDRAAVPGGIRRAVLRHRAPSFREAFDYAITAYDSEIRESDDYLAHLLAQIDDGHLAVIVTSDHGEEFDDHHGVGHGRALFEESVRIPLIVALPDQAPSVSTSLASIVDVMPTIIEIAHGERPTGIAGSSLLPATLGEALATRDVVFETGRNQIVNGIFDGRYKFIERVEPRPADALFDLEADLYEEHDCIAAHPDVAAPLRTQLHETLEAARARRPGVTTQTLALPATFREDLEGLESHN